LGCGVTVTDSVDPSRFTSSRRGSPGLRRISSISAAARATGCRSTATISVTRHEAGLCGSPVAGDADHGRSTQRKLQSERAEEVAFDLALGQASGIDHDLHRPAITQDRDRDRPVFDHPSSIRRRTSFQEETGWPSTSTTRSPAARSRPGGGRRCGRFVDPGGGLVHAGQIDRRIQHDGEQKIGPRAPPPR
jgi:hypothetical protein